MDLWRAMDSSVGYSSHYSDPTYDRHEAQEFRQAHCVSFNFSELNYPMTPPPPLLQPQAVV